MQKKHLFTSESVSMGHPDKLCDNISDAILDACLSQDPFSRVACECYATTNYVIIGGEITTNAVVDYEKVARQVIKKIGYTKKEYGIDYQSCKIDVILKKQSPDIARGVNNSLDDQDIGAGDQGIMFGYACNETKEYMPLAIILAHRLVELATDLRKNGEFKFARPDMKSQVTIDYTDPKKTKIDTILLSIQHDDDFNEEEFKTFIKEKIIYVIAEKYGFSKDFRILINPTGRFVIGGPEGDVGLTGRKIIVDTYGGGARHGGGAFSGKDCTKVDRSAAYAIRHIAKNIVAAGLADKCEIQISYAIGTSKPVSVMVETFGTNKVAEDLILEVIENIFDLTPRGIINRLDLRKPIYQATATYGHFGREEFSWEKLDYVDIIKKYIKDKKKS